jgi:plasmid stability protein
MKEVRVRNLPDEIVHALRRRAQRNGHSLEGELRELLTEEAIRPHRDLVASLKRSQEEQRAAHGVLSDSTPYIRAMRDGKA